MLTLTIEANTDDLVRRLDNLVKSQLPFATSKAINDTLHQMELYNRDLMKRAFDRPTRFTLNAYYVRRATKRFLQGSLERKDMVVGRHYLEVQDKGGPRGKKGFERNFITRLPYAGIIQAIVPTEHAPLDQHGNMTMAFLNRVMSQLQVASMGQNAKRAKVSKNGSGRFFVPAASHPLSQRRGMGSPGVFQTVGPSKAGRIKQVLAFSDSVPTYRPRTSFHASLTRAAQQTLPIKMRQALAHALRTARL